LKLSDLAYEKQAVGCGDGLKVREPPFEGIERCNLKGLKISLPIC
jgi:hypothetical protein